MTWALAYAAVSFVIGVWCELEMGASTDDSVRRMAVILGYGLLWPLMLAAAAWFWFWDPEDLL